MNRFDSLFDRYREQFEAYLPAAYLRAPDSAGGRVVEAARYSLLAGGKRLRPVLLMATADLLGGSASEVLPFAAAIEMIHTYSLIHDDLPCMDDDDLRRGRPTCHVQYGEAMAVLAGDALLNRAFEQVLEAGPRFGDRGWKAAAILSQASGSEGMIGGQALDLMAEEEAVGFEGLVEIHRRKTGALIKAPILMAAALMDASPYLVDQLTRYADAIGLAFQIRDDILDVTADQALLGKTTGKDARDHKTTYVSIFGLDGAQEHLLQTIASAREAIAALASQGLSIDFLEGLADYLVLRQS